MSDSVLSFICGKACSDTIWYAIYYIVQKQGFYKESAANPLLFDNTDYMKILCDNNTNLSTARNIHVITVINSYE